MEKRMGFNKSKFRAEERDGKKYIEGEFIVFNKRTQLWGNVYEEIAPESIGDLTDIRALYNHNQDIVLGTTGNKTVSFEKRETGLWGSIEVNEEDQDALNAHSRIKRGDVPGCSFGFIPTKEEHKTEGENEIFRVTEMQLFEVSPCVFPAYPQTSISARQKDFEEIKSRELTVRKKKLIEKTKRRTT